MASTWSWIAGRRRKEILEMCLSHLARVEEAARHALDIIEAYRRRDKRAALQAYQKLFKAEREADRVKHNIIEELSKEIFHPIDREELIRLVLAADDIADFTKAASRRILYLEPERLPEKVVEAYAKIANKLIEATVKAREAVSLLAGKPKEAIAKTHEIERLEEEVDDIRNETEEWILKHCNGINVSECLVTTKVLEALETSTDKAEDLGDVIRSIALLNL